MTKLVFLAMGMFTMGCSSYIIAGLLPAIGSTLGTSIAATGQGITVFGVTYIICSPVFAIVLAKHPARLILLLSLTLFAIGNIVTMMSTQLVVYLVGRAITGMGAGLFSPVCVGAAVQMVGPEMRGRALSVVWGANSAGAVIGVPFGLWLSERQGWQSGIGLVLALGVISMFGIAMRKLDLHVATPPSLGQRLRMLTDRRVLSVIAITLLTATGSLGLYAYVAPLQAGGASSLATALFVWSGGGLIGSTFVGQVVDRTGNPRGVMAGILAGLTISILVLPHFHTLPVVGLMPFFCWGLLGWATVTPQQHTLIGLQPDQSSTLAALNGSALALGSVLGAALGGFAIANGVAAKDLPYAAAITLACALTWQLLSLMPKAAEEHA